MKRTIKQMLPVVLALGTFTVHAQWYNDTLFVNSGSLIGDWSSQAWNSTNGNYNTAGSSGAPSNFGVFEHYGQTGTGNSSALRNDGSYDASVNGRDYFKGPNGTAGQQGIGGTVAPVFGDLFLQNGTGQLFDITNTNGIIVAGNLSFENGVTTTVRASGATGSIQFRDNATYSNTASGDAQFVNGYVTKTGNDAFTFPVGSQAGNDLRTLQITAPATATDALSVAYWSGSAPSLDPTINGTESLTALNPAGTAGVDQLFSVSPLCFWDWIPVSGTSSLTVTVSLPNFAVNGGYGTAADMRLVGWNTTTQQWDNLSGSTGATGTAEGSTISGTVSNMSNYSAIAIGNVITTPLPVDILSFEGYIDASCNAQLSWKTAHEKNTLQFIVQYSKDGSSYSNIGTVAALNKPEGAEYHFQATDLARGKALFRLMTEDVDGSKSYFNKVLSLDNQCQATATIRIWPNPTDNTTFIAGLESSSTVSLLDALGRELYRTTSTGNTLQLDMKPYKAGVYLVRITHENTAPVFGKITRK